MEQSLNTSVSLKCLLTMSFISFKVKIYNLAISATGYSDINRFHGYVKALALAGYVDIGLGFI